MKGLCFLVIGLALVISFQNNPLGTILMGGVGILIYAFLKSRKNRTSGGGLIFRKGATSVSPSHDLMTLLMVQAILDRNSRHDRPPSSDGNAKDTEIERLKHEVLALFEEE